MMQRRQFLALAAAFAACAPASAVRPPESATKQGRSPRFARGLLWRVDRDGIEPSHIFGTMHVGDPRLATLPGPVSKAFTASRSLTIEFAPDPYARERFLEAALFLDRQTLEGKIGSAAFEQIVGLLAPLGVTRALALKMKPWGVLVNLRNPKGGRGPTPDAQLLALAHARRLQVHPMEEVEEQVFTFDEFPMDSQVALLLHALAHQEVLTDMSERTLKAYLARDLAGLWRIQQDYLERFPEIAEHQRVFLKRVVFDRSVVMAFRMQRQLRRGRAFVALGALHLYGERGVLAALSDDGYRLHPVY